MLFNKSSNLIYHLKYGYFSLITENKICQLILEFNEFEKGNPHALKGVKWLIHLFPRNFFLGML